MTHFDILSSKQILQTTFCTILEERVRLPNTGTEKNRVIIQHNGASVFIPLQSDGSLFLIKQYRHAVRSTILEFPAGIIDPGETPLECAKRELTEEVGITAIEWKELGFFYTTPGFCDEKLHGFLASNLTITRPSPEEDEYIEIVTMRVPEVEQAIISGELIDSKSITIFFQAKLRGLL